MALYRCGSSGGTLSETPLWENPNTTSNFSSTAVDLLQSIANFTYIGVYLKRYKTDSDSAAVLSMMSVSDFSTANYRLGFATVYNNKAYGRSMQRTSDTKVQFNASYPFEINASAANNATNIPVKIVGLN